MPHFFILAMNIGVSRIPAGMSVMPPELVMGSANFMPGTTWAMGSLVLSK